MVNASEVLRLHDRRRDAMLSADAIVLNEVLSDDLTWIHASSKVDNKWSFLDGFRSDALRCFSLDERETFIRIIGQTALVTGIVEMDVAVAGVRRLATNRYTALWVEGKHATQLLLWQSTRLPQEV